MVSDDESSSLKGFCRLQFGEDLSNSHEDMGYSMVKR